MFEKFVITDHMVKRYQQRTNTVKGEIIERIKKDLHFTKIKQIVNIGNFRHVFTLHSKEFIFVRSSGKWVLKTIIKRTREENILAINKRKGQAAKVNGAVA